MNNPAVIVEPVQAMDFAYLREFFVDELLMLENQQQQQQQHQSPKRYIRPRLSMQEKLDACRRVRNGESKAAVGRDLDVPESTLRGWCKNPEIIVLLNSEKTAGRNNESFVFNDDNDDYHHNNNNNKSAVSSSSGESFVHESDNDDSFNYDVNNVDVDMSHMCVPTIKKRKIECQGLCVENDGSSSSDSETTTDLLAASASASPSPISPTSSAASPTFEPSSNDIPPPPYDDTIYDNVKDKMADRFVLTKSQVDFVLRSNTFRAKYICFPFQNQAIENWEAYVKRAVYNPDLYGRDIDHYEAAVIRSLTPVTPENVEPLDLRKKLSPTSRLDLDSIMSKTYVPNLNVFEDSLKSFKVRERKNS